MIKYLALFPVLAVAGDYQPPTYITELTENTYIDYQYDESIAALTAISSIPSLGHKKTHLHRGVGLGLGSYNDKTGLAVSIQEMTSKLNIKANIAFAGDEVIIGTGVTMGF